MGSTRMYRGRLRAWKLFKNLKSGQKTKLLLKIIEGQRESQSPVMTKFDAKVQRSLARHVKRLIPVFQAQQPLEPDEREIIKETQRGEIGHYSALLPSESPDTAGMVTVMPTTVLFLSMRVESLGIDLL